MLATAHELPRPEITRPAPAEYLFSEEDADRYEARHYRLPCDIVHDPAWPLLWRQSGKRGGGSAASILPVLTIHTFPGATFVNVPAEMRQTAPGWTPWAYVSIRRIAKLAGLDKDTAWRGLRSLETLGWAETRTVSCHKSGGRKTWFRLAERIFAEKGKQFAMIPASLIYRGTWMVLPTNASRFLYLTLAALDPIHDEETLKDAFDAEHGISEPEEQAAKLRSMREASSVSWSTLIHLTGLSRATLDEALHVLITPVFDDGTIPLVRCGGKARHARWYAIDKRASRWYYQFDYLNAQTELDVIRRQTWPAFAQRREAQKRQLKRQSRKRAGLMVGT